MKNHALVFSLVCAVLAPIYASADPLAECVAKFENGQVLKKKGQLIEAKKAFTECSERSCPSAMQIQCGKWLEDVDKMIPSVVFSVSVDNEEVLDVQVDMNGARLWDKLDVRGVEVDPGQHTFVLTVPGFPPVERKVVVREGEKLKSVSVTFNRPKVQAAASSEPSRPAAPASQPATRPIPTGVLVATGVGALGIIVGTTFELLGESDRSNLESSCKPQCSDSQVKSVHNKYVVGDAALLVGAAGLATGAVWYLMRPTRYEKGTLSIAPGVGSISLQGAF